MKIVILDGNALNPGDISWQSFYELGEVTLYDRTAPELVIERIGNAEIVIINKIQMTKQVIEACPSIKYIGVLATGYNNVDIAAAAQNGIVVTNIPSYSTNAVAQAVFALLLDFTNKAAAHSQSVHAGDWCKSKDFCYWQHPLTELSGKTFGIIGFGSIGQTVAKIALALGMKVQAFTRSTEKIAFFNKNCIAAADKETQSVKSVSLEELLSSADVISLHAPLTEKTKNLINAKTLALVKPSAILLNTARGPLVEEAAVRAALDAHQLAGYATDVLCVEPMKSDCPLLGAPNCLITPHVAWAAKETRERLMQIASDNLHQFLNGNPINRVN